MRLTIVLCSGHAHQHPNEVRTCMLCWLQVNRTEDPGITPTMTIAIKKYGRWTKVRNLHWLVCNWPYKTLSTLSNHTCVSDACGPQKLISRLQDGAGMPVRVLGPVGGVHTIGDHVRHCVMFVGGVGVSAPACLRLLE